MVNLENLSFAFSYCLHRKILVDDFRRFFKHDKPHPPRTPRGYLILWHPLFLPVASQRKKCVDELFRTGSVSHALLVMSQVPYSQHASCTKLGNCPTVWISHLVVLVCRMKRGRNNPAGLYFDFVNCRVIWLA